jgi:hypothetical protein
MSECSLPRPIVDVRKADRSGNRGGWLSGASIGGVFDLYWAGGNGHIVDNELAGC